MKQPTDNSYCSGNSKPDKQTTNNRGIIIIVIVCTVVLVMACTVVVVTVTLIVRKQQPCAAGRLDDLETKIISTNSELASTKTQLALELASLKTQLYSTTTELTSTKSELASTKRELATRTQAIDVKIVSPDTQGNDSIYGVFTARLSGDKIGMGRGQIVMFDDVVYNPGQDYDPLTGQFTCPLNGVYVFHVTVLTLDYVATEKGVRVDIVKDAEIIGETTTYGSWQSASVTVFTWCNKHQRVCVRIGPVLPNQSLNQFSYFSGAFQIFAQ